jgi:hypothetical protein
MAMRPMTPSSFPRIDPVATALLLESNRRIIHDCMMMIKKTKALPVGFAVNVHWCKAVHERALAKLGEADGPLQYKRPYWLGRLSPT